MARQHWLLKSEPEKYPFEQLVRDKRTVWDGIRNFTARNNLRTMKKGDACLFYHSNEGKAVVGIAEVVREAFPDPSTEEDFSAVEIEAVRALPRAVTLDEMRSDAILGQMMMFRQPRLSVVALSKGEFEEVLALAGKAAASPKPSKGAAPAKKTGTRAKSKPGRAGSR